MARRRLDEPKLCPTCTLKSLRHLVKPISYTRIETPQSAVKTCAKLRALSMRNPKLPKCPRFSVSERINGWFGTRKKPRRRKRK